MRKPVESSPSIAPVPAAVLGDPEMISSSEDGITLVVLICLKQRGGRIRIAHAGTAQEVPVAPTALQQGLVCGYRWRAMPNSGEVGTISEIAQRERMDISFVSKMINLTLLAPDLVEAILDDTLPERLRLNTVAINPPMEWEEHRSWLG